MNQTRSSLLLVTAHASRAGGGVSVATRDLARMMAAEFDVRVLTLAEGATRAEDEPEWVGIDVKTFATLGPKRYGFSPALLLAVMRARVDVVHVHGLWKFHCLAVMLLHLIRRTPYLVTPHGMLEPWIMMRSPRLKRLISRSYQNRFIRNAAAVHVLTMQEEKDVTQAIGKARCIIIPNFIEPVITTRREPGWWEQDFNGHDIFLFLGRIHSKKGCLELCDAWDQLNAYDTVFRNRSILIFCGVIDGLDDFPNRVRALSERYGNIRYVGPQYTMDKYNSLSTATFFCLPSRSEGLPIAVIEAWALGIPVLMTKECNLSIGFEKGAAIETGTDATAIMASLVEASTFSTERRRAMAGAGKALVEQYFSSTTAKRAYRTLYETIAFI